MTNDNFNIDGKIYHNVGQIIVNNHIYLFVKHENDLKFLQIKKVEGKLKYFFPNYNINNIEFKETILVENIVDGFKNKIVSGEIKTKEELQQNLLKAQDILTNDAYIKQLFQYSDVKLFLQNIKQIYKYFDTKMKNNEKKINFKNITSFEVENENGTKKEYIKRDNGNGDIDVLENNNKKDFVEQFNDAQNEYLSLNTGNDIENANATFDMLQKHTKIDATDDIEALDKIKDIKGEENIKGYSAINSSFGEKNNMNIVGDPERNLYIDTESGNVLTTDVKDDNVQISTVVEKNGNIEKNIDTTNDAYVIAQSMKIDELERALLTHRDALTDDQIKQFEEVLNQKQNKLEEDRKLQKSHEHEKRLELVLPSSDSRAAFINLIGLCSFVFASILLIILISIQFIK